MDSMGARLPQAREQTLTKHQVDDQLLVYDPERHRCHSLNQAVALVWQHCDGQTSVAQMTALLQQKLNLPPDAEIVRLALDELEKAHLLQDAPAWPADGSQCSRRQMIRKLGLAGAITTLLPLVESIVAPRPAEAASGGQGKGKGRDKNESRKEEGQDRKEGKGKGKK